LGGKGHERKGNNPAVEGEDLETTQRREERGRKRKREGKFVFGTDEPKNRRANWEEFRENGGPKKSTQTRRKQPTQHSHIILLTTRGQKVIIRKCRWPRRKARDRGSVGQAKWTYWTSRQLGKTLVLTLE